MTGNSIFTFILDFIELVIDVCGENYQFQTAYTTLWLLSQNT